jgi:uncharacterized MAPEG superfamily protein
MTIAFTCVLIATIMPLIWANIAKLPMMKAKNYDNKAPRLQMESLQGAAQRANWAQQNAFEALPGFAAAVIIAALAQAPQTTVDILAVVFIVCRLAFGIFYIKNWDIARSSAWVIAFFAMLGIYISAF